MTEKRTEHEQTTADDYRWLVSDDAAPWLDIAAAADGSSVQIAGRLRREVSAVRAHLVLEQAELRCRATRSGRFAAADRMFFTPKLMEQATSQAIAAYKAGRFAADMRVADLCCGIGGDLLALAERGPTVGVDSDEAAVLLAEANCRAARRDGVRVTLGDAVHFRLDDFDAWHADPDRRPAGRRTTRPELHRPSLDEIERLRAALPSAAVKLAPAAAVPEHWAAEAELEWIGEARECKQLVAWFGGLAGRCGRRVATVLRAEDSPPATVVGVPDEPVVRAASVGQFLYEPHATVIAARLVGALAGEHALQRVSADGGYLSGDRFLAHDAMSVFEVIDTMPFDIKRLKAALRQRRVGRLEVKKRGLDVDPPTVRRQLRVPGDEHRTLLLTRFLGRAIAILARRVS